MARPLRIDVEDGWYHITARGIERRSIFRGVRYYEHFLELLEEMTQRHGVRVHAYVLLGNHYHLIIQTPHANASMAIQWLNVSYSAWFNARRNRVGHISWTGGSYEHNAAGCVTNITDGSDTLSLSWDSSYNLTSVSTNGTVAEAYTYGPLGNRITTVVNGVTNHHVYADAHCIADLDANGDLIRSYQPGPGIDSWLSMTVHTGATPVVYTYLTDHLGTVHAVVDATGAIVESYRYDPHGKVLGIWDGTGSPLTQSAIGNRILWQGREYSWTTGLYYFRARWYDPITGRWLSKDPIGISGGLNQYVFCGNNPVNMRDPFGLCEEGQWIDVGEGVSMWITGNLNRFTRAYQGSRTISRTRLEPTLEPEPESKMIEFDILGIIMPTHVAPARRQYVTGSLEGDLRFHRANSFPRELATRGLGVQTTVIGIHQSVQSGAPLLFKVAVGGTRFGFQRAVLHNQANVNDRE